MYLLMRIQRVVEKKKRENKTYVFRSLTRFSVFGNEEKSDENATTNATAASSSSSSTSSSTSSSSSSSSSSTSSSSTLSSMPLFTSPLLTSKQLLSTLLLHGGPHLSCTHVDRLRIVDIIINYLIVHHLCFFCWVVQSHCRRGICWRRMYDIHHQWVVGRSMHLIHTHHWSSTHYHTHTCCAMNYYLPNTNTHDFHCHYTNTVYARCTHQHTHWSLIPYKLRARVEHEANERRLYAIECMKKHVRKTKKQLMIDEDEREKREREREDEQMMMKMKEKMEMRMKMTVNESKDKSPGTDASSTASPSTDAAATTAAASSSSPSLTPASAPEYENVTAKLSSQLASMKNNPKKKRLTVDHHWSVHADHATYAWWRWWSWWLRRSVSMVMTVMWCHRWNRLLSQCWCIRQMRHLVAATVSSSVASAPYDDALSTELAPPSIIIIIIIIIKHTSIPIAHHHSHCVTGQHQCLSKSTQKRKTTERTKTETANASCFNRRRLLMHWDRQALIEGWWLKRDASMKRRGLHVRSSTSTTSSSSPSIGVTHTITVSIVTECASSAFSVSSVWKTAMLNLNESNRWLAFLL